MRYVPATPPPACDPQQASTRLKLLPQLQPTGPPPPPLRTPFAATPTELTALATNAIEKEDTFPKEFPLQETIGKFSLMRPRTYALQHPAAPLLLTYDDKGCPVDCGEDWSEERIRAAILHGPHKSARAKDAIRVLREETKEKVEQNFARIVRFGEIANDIPNKLKISPVACIPHKSKAYRVILDLSFNFRHNGKKWPSVNDTTAKLAPAEAMVQLGSSLRRIIATLAKNFNTSRPFKFSKIDIKDGFWRLIVSAEDAWNFCYVLPRADGKLEEDINNIEIVVPHSLQMGWCESPPFFCASSETARDVINSLLNSHTALPEHELEPKMLPPDYNSPETAQGNTSLVEVYVDDFIGATNNLSKPHLQHFSRSMLHGIHSIYPPQEVTKHTGGDPCAKKKLEKGDGMWATEKEILGWNFDGVAYTIQLPLEKCEKILRLIKKVRKYKVIPLKRFQELLGKLQHASFGIPGGAGLFSQLQRSLTPNTDFIVSTHFLDSALQDWRTIIHQLKNKPTSVLQLVQDWPDYIGYCDACKKGMGGVWTPGLTSLPYTAWQAPFTKEIQDSLVTADNPNGTISMNDLELAGIVLNLVVLENITPNLKYRHIGIFCDNMSAVAWATRLRTSKSIPAARLLRMLGLRILAAQASSLTTLSIAGTSNKMADTTSRAFQNGTFFNTNLSLPKFFNNTFPLPQPHSWRVFVIPPKLLSRVISCVRGDILPMESLLRLPQHGKNIGDIGAHTATNSSDIPSSVMPPQLNNPSSSQPLLAGSGQVSTVAAMKSQFHLSRKRSRPSARPSNWLENKVPSTSPQTNISSQSNDVLKE